VSVTTVWLAEVEIGNRHGISEELEDIDLRRGDQQSRCADGRVLRAND
jgi:hypothetical protein